MNHLDTPPLSYLLDGHVFLLFISIQGFAERLLKAGSAKQPIIDAVVT